MLAALKWATLPSVAMGVTAANNTPVVEDVCQNDTTMTDSEGLTKPQYPGGEKALKKFISKNLKYPDEAVAYGVEGNVIMTFFVNEDGTISDISAHDCKIERFNTTKFSQETEVRQKELKEQFAKLFAKEGARVIRKMPKWTPAKIKGKVVRARMNQSIRFSIINK